MNIGITGSTGHLGNFVIEELLNEGVAPAHIVALARSPEKAAALKDKGIDVRIGDYTKPETLEEAFKGVDRLLMISASDIGQRRDQHRNVVEAAKEAGVKHLVYTSLFHADTSVSPLADEH
ncbi:MAG: NAD(P)H-binding protein, partial [Aliifodinibius sp.]|nr:NAD(P)H-binding protein [Fodinibius sp.]NIV15637.1 NAD(P)H-binding protein [Fodinibius sp.]NIY29393.1 NAD(P)H-binding protein [Fodinibius sp.]